MIKLSAGGQGKDKLQIIRFKYITQMIRWGSRDWTENSTLVSASVLAEVLISMVSAVKILFANPIKDLLLF